MADLKDELIAKMVNHVHEEISRLEKIQEEHDRDLSEGGGLNDYGRGRLASYRSMWKILDDGRPLAFQNEVESR